MSDAATFLRRTRPPRSTRHLFDYVERPGAATFLRRIRGTASKRTMADYLVPPAVAPRVPAPTPTPAPVPTPVPPPPSPPPPPSTRVGEARASEQRITLDGDRPVLSITPDDLPRTGAMQAVLTWNEQRTAGQVRRATDVHLGCLWQMTNGQSGVVQSVGQLLSAPGFGPRQLLRLGQRREDTGEPLTIDIAHIDAMRRMVLFGYGRRGAPAWADLGCRLAITLPSGARVQMWLDDPVESAATAVIASVHLVKGELIVRRENEYLPGPARDVAAAYGWELDWNREGTGPRDDPDR